MYISRTWLIFADVGFRRKSILFACCVEELSIHVHGTWLAQSINKWVRGMAVRGGLSPLSGLKFVKLLIQLVREILHLSGNVRERSWKCQKSLAVATIYLSSPGISLWSCHHHFFSNSDRFILFGFFVFCYCFFRFLVERCRSVSQGDDVAATLNWSSDLLYSRWVFPTVTNHITIHTSTFGFFLEGLST